MTLKKKLILAFGFVFMSTVVGMMSTYWLVKHVNNTNINYFIKSRYLEEVAKLRYQISNVAMVHRFYFSGNQTVVTFLDLNKEDIEKTIGVLKKGKIDKEFKILAVEIENYYKGLLELNRAVRKTYTMNDQEQAMQLRLRTTKEAEEVIETLTQKTITLYTDFSEKNKILIRENEEVAAKMLTSVLSAMTVVAIFTLIFIVWFINSITKPLKALHKGIREASEGHLEVQLEENQSDEMGKMIRVFNKMVKDLSKAQNYIIRQHRTAHLDLVSKQVARDLKGRLDVILGFLQMLMTGSLSAEEVQENHQEIYKTSLQGKKVCEQLISYPDPLTIEKTTKVVLDQVIAEGFLLIERLAPKGITLQQKLPPGLWGVVGTKTFLLNMLINMARNAFEAMPDGGEFSVKGRNITVGKGSNLTGMLREGQYVWLVISDTGRGIPDESKEDIFEPFFTTKSDEIKTMGLGLAMVREGLRQLGGKIVVESSVSNGAVFHVFLPAFTGTMSDFIDQQKAKEAAALAQPEGQSDRVDDVTEVVDEMPQELSEAEAGEEQAASEEEPAEESTAAAEAPAPEVSEEKESPQPSA